MSDAPKIGELIAAFRSAPKLPPTVRVPIAPAAWDIIIKIRTEAVMRGINAAVDAKFPCACFPCAVGYGYAMD